MRNCISFVLFAMIVSANVHAQGFVPPPTLPPDTISGDTEFLNCLQRNSTPVSIVVQSGVTFDGTITRHAGDAVFLLAGVTQLIYKHAIATIIPATDTCDIGNGFAGSGQGQ